MLFRKALIYSSPFIHFANTSSHATVEMMPPLAHFSGNGYHMINGAPDRCIHHCSPGPVA